MKVYLLSELITMPKNRQTMKKFILIYLIIIMFMCLCIYYHYCDRDAVAVLYDYKVYFGDSPRMVFAQKLGHFVEKEELSYSNETVYSFETVYLDEAAKIYFYFLNNKCLSTVEIEINNLVAEREAYILETVKDIIQKSYATDDSFICKDAVVCDDGSYRLSMFQENGAVGVYYSIAVKNNSICISCSDGK